MEWNQWINQFIDSGHIASSISLMGTIMQHFGNQIKVISLCFSMLSWVKLRTFWYVIKCYFSANQCYICTVIFSISLYCYTNIWMHWEFIWHVRQTVAKCCKLGAWPQQVGLPFIMVPALYLNGVTGLSQHSGQVHHTHNLLSHSKPRGNL